MASLVVDDPSPLASEPTAKLGELIDALVADHQAALLAEEGV